MKTDYQLIQDYLFGHLEQVMKQPYGAFRHPFIDPARSTTATSGTGTLSGRSFH